MPHPEKATDPKTKSVEVPEESMKEKKEEDKEDV